jgi:integrase
MSKRQVHVCRTGALGEIIERTKTGHDRYVLLNDRAIHALHARTYAERRQQGPSRIKNTP